MKSLIMILLNTTAGTYHPILYLESPMPGNVQPSETARRYKSKFHHTEGFATKEEAQKNIEDNLAARIAEHFPLHGTPIIDFDTEQSWDGQDIPASVIFYNDDENTLVLG